LEVSPQDILVFGASRLQLEWRMQCQRVSASIGIAPSAGHHDRCPRSRRQLERSEPSAGRAPEKLDEDSLFAARVLVQQHNDVATLRERPNELDPGAPSHRDLLDRLRFGRLRVGTRTRANLKQCSFESRLSKAAIDRRHRDAERGELRRAELPVPEMRRDDHRTLSPGFPNSSIEVFQTGDLHAVEQLRAIPPQHQNQLGESLSKMAEDFFFQELALLGIDLGQGRRDLLTHAPGTWATDRIPDSAEAMAEAKRSLDPYDLAQSNHAGQHRNQETIRQIAACRFGLPAPRPQCHGRAFIDVWPS
jgi:hypothetical protein